MSILRHPGNPTNPDWALLADFDSGWAIRKPEHEDWLDAHAIPALKGHPAGWVFIRGFASRLGAREANLRLSEARALAVQNYILADPTVDPSHITGVRFRGEEWATDTADEDDPRWRSVEVIVTRARRARPALIREQRPETIERVVELLWIGSPVSQSGRPDTFPGDPGGGVHWADFVMETVLPNEPNRTTRSRFPISYRVNSIVVEGTYGGVGYDWKVTYEWGPPTATVSLDESGRRRMVSREAVRPWIEEPADMIFRPHRSVD